jgi:NADP-dependent 3-hydroxy acid dehydrogenase YdfG
MTKRLTDKTALITGGGTGIGAACAVALAGEGCRVVITGRRDAKLREAAARFTGDQPLLTRVLDVADRQNVTDVFDWATRELGKIDILVQSAGINVRDRSMADLSPDDWDKLLQVNATGAYNCMRAVLPQMRERRDGLIVNISSIAGLRAALLGGVAYKASKFAMRALGTTVSLEDGANGIRVTTIFPGEVDTPILEQRPVPVTAEHRAKILQPEDVAAAVLMIACLPPRAHVQELIIKPTSQPFL